MTATNSETETSASAEGASLIQKFEPDDGDLPKVMIRMGFDREGTAVIRIVEDLPENIPPEHVGYRSEDKDVWRAEGDNIIFEKEASVGPDDPLTTMFVIRDFDASETDPAELDAPSTFEVEWQDDASGEPPESEIEGAPPVPGVEGDSLDPDEIDELEYDGDGTRSRDEGIVTSDGSPPDVDQNDEQVGEQVEGSDGDITADFEEMDTPPKAERAANSAYTTDTSGGKLASELRRGRLDDDTRVVLANEIERLLAAQEGDTSSSLEVRVRYLQQRLSSLGAYIDGLEEFIKDGGTADELIRTTQESISELHDRADSIEESLSDAEAERGDIGSAVDELSQSINEIEVDIEALEGRLAEAADDRDDIRERVGDAEADAEDAVDRAERAEDTADEAAMDASDAASVAEGIQERTEEIESELSSLSAELESVEEDLVDVTDNVDGVEDVVGDVATTVEENSEDISDLDDRVSRMASRVRSVREDIDDISTDAGDAAGLSDKLEERIEALEEQVVDMQSSGGVDEDRIVAIEDRLDSIENDVGGVPDDFDERLRSVEGQSKQTAEAVNGIVEELAKLRDAVADEDGEMPDIQELESQVEELSTTLVDTVNDLQEKVNDLQRGGN